MKKVFYCPICKKASVHEENWDTCFCGASLMPTIILEDEWNKLSDQEKNNYITEWKKQPVDANQYLQRQNKILKDIAGDIHVMYLLVLVGVIVSVVGSVIAFLF